MKKATRILMVLIMVSLIIPFGVEESAGATHSHTCFPTCDETDGRFLTLEGTGLQTLAGDVIRIGLAAPSSELMLEFDIFDGDTGGLWDQGSLPLEYILYADPAGDGSGSLQVGQWTGDVMPDNEWFSIQVPNGPESEAPSGHYFYILHVRNPNPSVALLISNFKIRAPGAITLEPPHAFAFIGALFTYDEAYILYPDYPDFTITTYDGHWDIFLDVPTPTPFLAVWDGDFDHGSHDCLDNDTDDGDTPNDGLPPWAVGTAAVFEGIAVGTFNCRSGAGKMTGAPPDDYMFPAYRRTPSVVYEVIDPSGTVYLNDNPSGTEEWEQFRIESDPIVPADHYVDGLLPAGIYQIHMSGMDLHNLNAWRFEHDVVGICEDGTPCEPLLRPYLVGDYVWNDANGDGLQDDVEIGIGGVIVNLLDPNGYIIATTTTGPDGYYEFEVDAGEWTVQVAPSNFEPGGALYGYQHTSDPDGNLDHQYTDTVTNDKVMIYDFGYRPATPPGTGTPGYWKNHAEAWPVEEITIGDIVYSKAEAIDTMNAKSRNDKSYDLFRTLVSARLNVALGNEWSCVQSEIDAADAWFIEHPVGSGVKANTDAWQTIEPVFLTLDEYNNGLLCAPSRG